MPTALTAVPVALCTPAAQAADTETRHTAYVYNTQGQVIRELIEPQDSSLCLVTEYTYDGSGTRWLYETCNVGGVTCPQAGVYRLVYRLTHYEVSGANVATDAGTKNGPYGRSYHDRVDHAVVEESKGWDGAGHQVPHRNSL